MTTGAGIPDPAAGYAETRAEAFSGVRVMLLRHVAVAVMTAGGTTYLVRELGPASWGGFAVAYMLLVAGDTLVTRGLIVGLLRREVPDTPPVVAAAARIALVAGVGMAAVFAVLPVAASEVYDPPRFGLVMLATAGCLLLYAARALPLTLLERDLRYRPVALAEVADMAAFYAVAIPLVATGTGIEALAPATLARGLVAFAVVRLARRAPVVAARERPEGRALLAFGLPLAGVLVLSAFDGLIPIVIIGGHEDDVGFLLTAASLLGYAAVVLTAVQRVAVPSLSQLAPVQLREAISRSVSLGSFLTLGMLVPLGGLAEVWVGPLLGADWEPGVLTVQLVALALATVGPIGVLTAALTAGGFSADVLRAQLASFAVYAFAAVVLVLVLGPIGCAAGYAVSRWTWLAIVVWQAHARLGIGLPLQAVVQFGIGLWAFAALVAVASLAAGVALAVAVVVGVVWLALSPDLARVALRALRPQGAG